MKELSEQFQKLVKWWGHPWVAHKDIEQFTGGQLTRGSLRTLCWKGIGPPSFYIGAKRVSDVVDMAEWLEGRSFRNTKNKETKRGGTCAHT